MRKYEEKKQAKKLGIMINMMELTFLKNINQNWGIIKILIFLTPNY